MSEYKLSAERFPFWEKKKQGEFQECTLSVLRNGHPSLTKILLYFIHWQLVLKTFVEDIEPQICKTCRMWSCTITIFDVERHSISWEICHCWEKVNIWFYSKAFKKYFHFWQGVPYSIISNMNQPFEALYIGFIKNCKSVPCVPALVFAKEKELSLVERFHVLSVLPFFSDFYSLRTLTVQGFLWGVSWQGTCKLEKNLTEIFYILPVLTDPASYAISCAHLTY